MDNNTLPFELFIKSMTGGENKFGEQIENTWKHLLAAPDADIASTPFDTVYEEDRVKLKRYRPTCGTALGAPLLMVYALINRETMLDLQHDRSVVRTMLDAGIDLYMIDWGYPTAKDKYLTIDDHVNGYLDHIVDYILKTSNAKSLNLMGICMGGTFSVIYAAQHPEKVKNLITTVTPTNFDTQQGLLHVWAKDMDVDGLVDSFGNVPGDMLNMGFLLLNPARLMIDKYVGFFRNISDKSFVENFMRMEKWIFDSPDVPGETFRQFVKDCYQKNLLIQNKMDVGGRIVDLKKITMPVLNFYGKFDHLVPPEACNRLTKSVGSKDVEDVCLDTGHIGIYVSLKSVKGFAPKIVDWLLERNLAEGYGGSCSGSNEERVKSAKKRRKDRTSTNS